MTPPRDRGPDEPSTVTVELRLFATIRAAVGERTLVHRTDSPITVRSVLAHLETTYPGLEGSLLNGTGELRSSIAVLRNGRHIDHFDGVGTQLADGDVMGIMPPVSGGARRRCRGPDRR